MKTVIRLIIFSIVLSVTACQKESQPYIPQRSSGSVSIDHVDSTQGVVVFASSTTALKPSSNHTIVSGATGVRLLSDSATYVASPSQPQGCSISKIRFAFIGSAGISLDFNDLSLQILDATGTPTQIAHKNTDQVDGNGQHYIQFTGLQDSTELVFANGTPQWIRLVATVTGSSGESFTVKILDGTNIDFTDGFGAGHANVSGLPVTCAGTTTIQ